MTEESHYSTDNKRKYVDGQAPPSRRPTGFSAPISSLSPTDASSASQQTVSYNSVPPPMDEIQLAKQKAQEIAARLFSNAEATKKPRVENGNGGGYDENEGMYQKSYASMAPPPTSSYGYSSSSKKIDVPQGRVGVIIGKGGETIKYLQLQSGAKIQVTRDMDADPNLPTRAVELMGTPEQISKAEQLIQDVLAEATVGGSGGVSRRGEQAGSDHFAMIVPNNKVGLVIGKGGETIKNMQARTGARIQVIPLHLPPGDTSGERTVQIDGTSEQIEAAKQLVNEVISENRMRNQGGGGMSGGYSQQGGYQARPQTNWAPPSGAPMQQSGYGGYVQPGAYPGSAQQYNPNQPPYPSYPPQPTSGGYATGWDQTAAPPNQQQTGGYDYYGQQTAPPPPPHQQPAGGPADNSGYAAYNQPPASYDYSAYTQSGYGQPQTNPNVGYDQQQGYNSAAGPEGQTPYGTTTQGSDGTQVPPGPTGQQPSPKPGGYPPQPGYGVPPPASQGGYATQPPGAYYPPQQQVQKPPPGSQPSYGHPQQSPSAQGGGYDQSGYPPVQPSYGQPETAGQQPPSGYGPPPPSGYGGGYGAPPPNYGQYSGNYGGGYGQPQAYSGDGGARGGTSDLTPSQAAGQPSGPPKASPPS